MIEKIRKPKKSRNIVNYTVYALIFGMIIATFVFMIPGLGDGGGAVNAAAEVGSTSISLRDYTDQLRRTRDQYSKLFNGEIPAYFEQNLRNQVLQGLVKREVLNQYAQKQDLIVAPVEIADFIKKEIPAFQEDGVFSYSLYNTYLKNTRSTAKKFEDMVYKDIASRRIYDLFSKALSKSAQEDSLAKEAANVEVAFSYIKLDNSSLEKAVQVSDSQVQAFLADSSKKGALSAEYSKNIKDFEQPAKVELSYMLIKDKAVADEVAKTLTPENFADVAREKSEDPLSKAKGGDLGEIEKGSFSPEIEAKAFAMKNGELSAPFKTGLGYAILHVRKTTPKSVKPMEEVQDQIAKSLLQKEGVNALKADLLKASKAGTSDFDSKISSMGLSWNKEEKYSLGAPSLPGIGDSQEIADKLLSLRKNQMYQNIVSFKDAEYFIKLNNLTSKPVKEEAQLSQNNTVGRSNQLIDLLYENEKSALNIELNQQILNQ